MTKEEYAKGLELINKEDALAYRRDCMMKVQNYYRWNDKDSVIIGCKITFGNNPVEEVSFDMNLEEIEMLFDYYDKLVEKCRKEFENL